MVAATALEHQLTVATRNVTHFKSAGVKVVDPFAEGKRPLSSVKPMNDVGMASRQLP